ncbi:MAG: hypothetical protein Q8910_00070 [Bacteroidota bacterium]|nr:hypothetical protein [Bacteroidota bacterium]
MKNMEIIVLKASQIFKFESLDEIEDWVEKLQQRVDFIKANNLKPPYLLGPNSIESDEYYMLQK